jgi:hypothetical protein
MDTTTLIDQARSRLDHAAQKRIQKEKYLAKMVFAYNGGMWQAGPELLACLAVCKDDQVVLLDLYQNPVEVAVKELQDLTYSRWQEQMNAWLVEHAQTQNQR